MEMKMKRRILILFFGALTVMAVQAQDVKREARKLLADFTIDGLVALNEHFVQRNISPGGDIGPAGVDTGDDLHGIIDLRHDVFPPIILRNL